MTGWSPDACVGQVRVRRAVAAALDALPDDAGRSPSPPAIGGSGADEGLVAACRRAAAALLGGVPPERVILTSGATHALNLAILGMAGRAGSAVTSVNEHNSVLRPLFAAARRCGTQVQVIGLGPDGALDREAFHGALDRRPGLVAISHASNVTGRVNDVEPLFRAARAVGAVTLLDASQSVGHLRVHPTELAADMVAFPAHKALMGPAGVGVLYVSPGLSLDQVIVGGTGVRSEATCHPEEMPIRLEAGTPNTPGIAGFGAALEWHQQRAHVLAARCDALACRLRAGLRAIPGVRVCDDVEGVPRVAVASITVRGWRNDDVGYMLRRSFGIVCRTGLHCAPLIHRAIGSAPLGTVRLSLSGLNTRSDIVAALAAIERIAAAG